MGGERVCKSVRQYSSVPISWEDMHRLEEIASDYTKVKNYVYQRYGGIKSLGKIYPGYTVQNEMTASGLREELNLPSTYFYAAIFDALGDIKSQWTRTKSAIYKSVAENEGFTQDDRHYLRFVVKVSSCFDRILTGEEPQIPEKMLDAYRNAADNVDTRKLDRYLCRQVRRKHRKLHTEKTDGFCATERAYRYGDHGIYLSTKEKRKRVFVQLTDENCYKRQIFVCLKPEEKAIEIHVPVDVRVRRHNDYRNEIGISLGIWQMFTTDSGHVYGADYGKRHMELADFLQAGSAAHCREKAGNSGCQKYNAKKIKLERGLENYVNREINRMLTEEKPCIIYFPRLPNPSKGGANRKINYSVGVWKRGFIRRRLEQKCRENGIQIVEVFGKGISLECSQCGKMGSCNRNTFRCGQCGYEAEKKVNAARNAKQRGIFGMRMRLEGTAAE